MQARREFRDRPDVEVAVLDALVDRAEEGMTVFEVRAAVEADIDSIEEALAALKQDDLIRIQNDDDRVVIRVEDRVVPDPQAEIDEEHGWIDLLRERFGL
jgi:Ser/Thr protein kinase RdoA (MazF antagonist)